MDDRGGGHSFEQRDQRLEVLHASDLVREVAGAVAEYEAHLGRGRRAAREHRDVAAGVDEVSDHIAADEACTARDEYGAACFQRVAARSTARAVASSVTTTFIAPALRAPRMASRLSRPAAIAITSGICFKASQSMAMRRSSS